jgi:hypothetical protein
MNPILHTFIMFKFSVRITLITDMRAIIAVAVIATLVSSIVAASTLAMTEDVDAKCKKCKKGGAAAAAAASGNGAAAAAAASGGHHDGAEAAAAASK